MSRVIAQVVDQIVQLRQEVHRDMNMLKDGVHQIKYQLSKMEGRLFNVESALGLRSQIRGEIRNRFFEHAFKAGWLIGSVALVYVVANFHNIFH